VVAGGICCELCGVWCCGVMSGERGKWENGKVKGVLSGGLPVIYLDKVDEVGLDKSLVSFAKIAILIKGMDMRVWTLRRVQYIYHECHFHLGSILVALGCVSSGTS
jgi:hypothetical protein